MDFEHIEHLLQRYWLCETTLEEEAQLREFFSRQQSLPAHLLRYRDWFAGERCLQDYRLDEDFDRRILAQIEPAVKARRLTLTARFMPLLRAAAVVAVVLVLGGVVQHSFFDGEVGVMTVDTIGNQKSAPSVAFSTDAGTAEGQQVLDTLGMPEKLRMKDEHRE